MTRIDRYLLFLYLRVLCICFCSLAGLLIVVLFFTNLDEFQRFAEQTNRSLLTVVAAYYGPFLLSFFERLSGLLALLALLFVVAWLNKTNEFTAMMAAGVTKRRVVRPLLLASGVVILGAAAAREWAIPQYQDQLDRNPQDLTGELPRQMKPTFEADAGALFHGKHLLPATYTVVSPYLTIQGEQLAEQFGSKVVATKATYQRPTQDRPLGYMFEAVTVPRAIDQIPSASTRDGRPLLLTSHDTDWVPPGNAFLVSKTEFEMLRGGSSWKDFASTQELVEHLQGEKLSGNDLRVQIHGRYLRPLIDWTVILLGVPVLLTRPDRHMFWVAGTCLFIVAGFSIVVLSLSAIGTAGVYLSPTLATWLPVIVFLPWGWAKTASAMES
ncbi:MAG: LptF/LptG family permease [Aureliella sp.]